MAALVASAAVFAAMVQTEKNVLSQYEKDTVLTAAAEIPKGQMITEENIHRYFAEQQLDKTCIPSAALNSEEQAEGLIAVFDIEQGVLLTDGMFQKTDDILKDMVRPVVAGLRADDIYQVAGGVLRAGDRVNIYCVGEEGTELVWEKVFVQQVFDAGGTVIANEDRTTAAQRINILMNESDIADFYAGLAAGSLRVVKLLE